MTRTLSSFQIASNGKLFDYRLGRNLNLSPVIAFFQKNYQVEKIRNDHRHVLGLLTKNNTTYFLKLSTSEGISILTKREYEWNNSFNKNFSATASFRVPQNYDCGFYRKKYFYLITDYFQGEVLCGINNTYKSSNYLSRYISSVIELSELIQQMKQINFTNDILTKGDYKKIFTDKTHNWFNDIPIHIRKKFKIDDLLDIVEKGIGNLQSKPRHGDFTPWHIIKLKGGNFGLIDGEHALEKSVENYDICYFIQRVFSVSKNPNVSCKIYFRLLHKGYRKDKLKTALAARAIGGFLDESLTGKADYQFANTFKDWVMST